MKNLLLLLFAIPLITKAQQDPQATKILDELSAKHKANKTSLIDFDLLIDDNTNNVHSNKAGNVKIKGDKYILNLFGELKKCNAKNIWSIKKEEKQVTKDVYNPKANGGLKINELFTIYKSGYKYKYMGEKKLNAKAYHCIDLYPDQSNTNQYKRITIYIDKTTKTLYKIEFAEKRSARITTIVVKKITPNITIADTDFDYIEKRDCPGCEIDDASTAE